MNFNDYIKISPIDGFPYFEEQKAIRDLISEVNLLRDEIETLRSQLPEGELIKTL